MHILVCPHELSVGGSQINALELAREVRDAGHRVTIYAAPDVLTSMIGDFGLDYIEAPPRTRALDLRAVHALTRTVQRLGIDLVHAYEWPSSLEAAYGPARSLSTPTVMTVLSMDVPDFLPRHLPLIVGTHALSRTAVERGRAVHVIEPPIDLEANSPSALAHPRNDLGLDESALVISVVGRLSTEHEKFRGVLTAIAVVGELARTLDVTLIVAGDGEGMPEVRALADEVNARNGVDVIRVMGNLLDPRPVYAAADIVLGMGGSALKGMAFGKPLVVQGAHGFWRLLTPESQGEFLSNGFFGTGGEGAVDLRSILRCLSGDPTRRLSLGGFGRSLVESRFGVERAGERLAGIYAAARAGDQRQGTLELARTAVEFAKFRASLSLQATRRSPRPELARV